MNTQIIAIFVLALIMMASGMQSVVNDEEFEEALQLAELCRTPQLKEICRKLGEQMAEDGMLEMKEKRKPSFVRFGKRSGIEMEKRKPSFVRFGRK